MTNDPIAALREGSKESWTSSLSGVTYTYRRLTKPDVVECPDALPIFDLAIKFALAEEIKDPGDDQLANELAKRRHARMEDAEQKASANQREVEAFLLQRAVLSPRILENPDDYGTEPPDGALFVYQIPELDREQLVGKIQRLMSGMDALERLVAAKRAASFREDTDRDPDASPEHESDQAVGVVGNRE